MADKAPTEAKIKEIADKAQRGQPDPLKKSAGRPLEFDQTTADMICERLADGESLREICLDDKMPARSTVFKWLSRVQVFADQYACAREAQADAIFDDILEIADDGRNDWMERKDSEDANLGWRENGEALRRSALRVDARKWMAGKLRPKKYSDKMIIGGDSSMDPIETTAGGDRELAKAVAFILAKGMKSDGSSD